MAVTTEEAKANPGLYKIDDSGLIINRQTGKIAGNDGAGKYGITSTERALELHKRRRANNIRADMLGAIYGADIEIDPDASDEEVIAKYGNSRSVVIEHLTRLTLKANTLRDVPAAVTKILEVDKDTERPSDPYSDSAKLIANVTVLYNALKEAAQPDHVDHVDAVFE